MLSTPFRGRDALVAGLVTPAQLRGPRFRPLFSGVFVAADAPLDYATWCRAGALIDDRGVLGGWSAAELLGASCAPRDAPVELIVAGSSAANRVHLVVRGDLLGEDEVTTVSGVPVTTPLRTAFDLGRRQPVVQAICALDALMRVCGLTAGDVTACAQEHRYARYVRQLPEVLRRSTPLAGSPMESRARIGLEDEGLPPPALQYPVGPYLLDLAYPELKLGMEYDGKDHFTRSRVTRDLRRQAFLSSAGWEVLRFTPYEVFHPALLAGQVRAARARRAVDHHGYAVRTTNT